MARNPEIEARLQRVLTDALSVNLDEGALRPCRRLDELLALDSMSMFEIVIGLEKEFGFTMAPERMELERLNDLDELIPYLAEQAKRSGG